MRISEQVLTVEGEPESCRDGLVMFIIGLPDFPEC